MMNCILIIHSPSLDETMRVIMDSFKEVEDWMRVWPGTILIKTEKQPSLVAAVLHKVLPEALFMAAKLEPSEVQGWMPEAVWSFVIGHKPTTP